MPDVTRSLSIRPVYDTISEHEVNKILNKLKREIKTYKDYKLRLVDECKVEISLKLALKKEVEKLEEKAQELKVITERLGSEITRLRAKKTKLKFDLNTEGEKVSSLLEQRLILQKYIDEIKKEKEKILDEYMEEIEQVYREPEIIYSEEDFV